jgi:hypothetical protein
VAVAFPGVPYDGQATATGVDIDLQIPLVADLLEIVMSSQAGTLSGAADTPVATGGVGNGIDVTVPLGVPGGITDLDIVNSATNKTYDGDPTPITDTDSVSTVNGPLINSGTVSSTTTSQVTSMIARTDGITYIRNPTVGDGLIGGINILAAEAITDSVIVETTVDHKLQAVSTSILEDLSIDLPLVLSTVNIISADRITATATAISSGDLADAVANSDVGFVNLTVGGMAVPTPSPGDIFTVTGGIVPTDLARVTIVPITTTALTATSSTATVTAILIEVLAGDLSGTIIQIGHAETEANVANNTPTGPTAVFLTSFQAVSDHVPLIIPSLSTLFLLMFTGIIWHKRRNCKILTHKK